MDPIKITGIGDKLVENSFLQSIKWNAQGLIPVVVQSVDTKTVLMLAWMNEKALQETQKTGQMCYYSRSRKKLWRKGESSGNNQKVIELFLDCDGDTILAVVKQTGVACHTGRKHCFFQKVDGEKLTLTESVEMDPESLYGPDE